MTLSLSDKAKKTLVVRHNKLIESKHRLSLAERRFMLWMVSKIKKDDEELKVYTLKVSEFVAFAGLKNNEQYYPRLVKLADSLTQKNLGIMDMEKKQYDAFSWFDHISYKWGEGLIEAQIHRMLKPYLLQLKEQYTAIQLEYALLLRHESSHRLYDLLKQYQKIGSRHLKLAEFRNMMAMNDKKYPRYADFRRWVIEPAQKEINTKTDIYFAFEPTKTGRKITGLLFTIRSNKPAITIEGNPEETNPDIERLYKKLLKHGVKPDKTARNLVADYDTQRVAWHIADHEARIKKGEKVGAGRLVKGIKEDWRPQPTIFEKQEKQARQNKQRDRDRTEAIQKTVEKLEAKLDRLNRDKAEEVFSGLPEEEQKAIEKAFEKAHKTDSKGDHQTRKNTITKILFSVFVKKEYPEKFMSLLEYAKVQGAKAEILEAVKKQ